jgi:hypothetical protein
LFILSNADHIHKIEKYMEKIFANIKAFVVTDGSPAITGLYSKEGEVIKIASVTWKNEDIEKWINKLEEKMREAVR